MFRVDGEGWAGGSKDSGMLEGLAREVGAGWELDELSLQVGDRWIDLLAEDG
ncbi:MAG: hypothetical protein O7B99_08940 [Planctomycetota bacterium]|nr:hypothetical protein [Planctomycetota bacterium]